MGIVNILQQIQERIEDMPTIPMVAMRLMKVVSGKEHSLRDVARVIENDPALTVKVLRLANSAAFAGSRKFNTINSAVVRLGTQLVVGMVLRTLASGIFDKQLFGYESASEDFWNHSLRTAIASREIAKLTDIGIQLDLVFTAGLLHDIGKSVLTDFLSNDVKTMTKWCDALDVRDYLEAERNVIGTDHAEVGYTTAVKWGLPKVLCEAIRFHHNPAQSDPEYAALTFAIHVGDITAMLGGSGTGADSLAYSIDQGYKDYFEIPRVLLDKILLIIEEEFSVTREAFTLVRKESDV